jgi:uncharacterized membrane protein
MALLIGFYIIMPAGIILICMKSSFLDRIGSVILCYIAGIVLGNCGILPETATQVQNTLSAASVALALPLLVFSMDVKAWFSLAGKAVLSMVIAMGVIIAAAWTGSLLIMNHVHDAWKLAGMAIGVYTGGTPNLAAVKVALNVDPATYIILHTYDTMISFIYLIFVMTIAKKLIGSFLPVFDPGPVSSESSDIETEDISSYKNMINSNTIKQLAAALLLSCGIVAISAGAAQFLPEQYSTAVTILLITSLGIAASFVKKIQSLEKTYQFGMYIILIFCLVVGSMVNLRDLVNIHWYLMAFIGLCIFGSFILHALFCRIFKIDTDTFLITSVSAICSPPFVPVVANALKNRHIILSGLTTGIMGYAFGNYLAITMAYIFKTLAY